MKYLKIFEEILEIMEKDYSGCNIKRDWSNGEYYKKLISQLNEKGELDRSRFKKIVDDYILDFKDNHILFNDNKSKNSSISIGFNVRRYEGALYVISTNQEKNLKIGTQIIELGNEPINEVAERFNRELMEQPNERQLWEKIIMKYKTITVMDDGKISKFNINEYPYEDIESKYECECIAHNTILLRYNDFMDYDLSQTLLSRYEQEIIESKNLIIDVRNNSGGSDSVFLGLLDYIFPENYILEEEYGNLTNVTERNYNNRMEMFNEYLIQYPNDEMAKKYVNELTKNKNKGFVSLDLGSDAFVIKGMKEEKKVVVLTDRYCGSSGESFVIFASYSPWVTTIGRPTYGVIDYSNVAEQNFEDGFSLYYPTSVYEGVSYGKGYDNVGVKPDIYIPWTPEHIKRDVDLEYALDFLNKDMGKDMGTFHLS